MKWICNIVLKLSVSNFVYQKFWWIMWMNWNAQFNIFTYVLKNNTGTCYMLFIIIVINQAWFCILYIEFQQSKILKIYIYFIAVKLICLHCLTYMCYITVLNIQIVHNIYLNAILHIILEHIYIYNLLKVELLIYVIIGHTADR